MNNSRMKYKDFEWKHNPETIEITLERGLRRHLVPYVGGLVQDMGGAGRVIKGSGCFFGEECLLTFLELSAVLDEHGPGTLSLPGLEPFSAVVRSYGLSCEPGPELVRYQFEFWETAAVETASPAGAAAAKSHTAQSGETLWSVALLYGVTVDGLLKANPGIRRPADLTPGQRVVLP